MNFDNLGEENFFTVDTTTGIITIHEINRDKMKRELFRFQIIAYEKNNITSMIDATIIVIVEDKNDNIPKISPDKLSIDIDEETYMTLDFKQLITISDIDLVMSKFYSNNRSQIVNFFIFIFILFNFIYISG